MWIWIVVSICNIHSIYSRPNLLTVAFEKCAHTSITGNTILAARPTINAVTCGRLCINTEGCSSFTYAEHDGVGQCELYEEAVQCDVLGSGTLTTYSMVRYDGNTLQPDSTTISYQSARSTGLSTVEQLTTSPRQDSTTTTSPLQDSTTSPRQDSTTTTSPRQDSTITPMHHLTWPTSTTQSPYGRCGSILLDTADTHPSLDPPNGWVLCYLTSTVTEHYTYGQWDCIDLLQNVPIYNNGEGINLADGHVGCYGTIYNIEYIVGSCAMGSPNHNPTLKFHYGAAYYTYFGICYTV